MIKTALEHYYPKEAPEWRRLLNEIVGWLETIPPLAPVELISGEDRLWSCHVLSRGVLRLWNLEAQGWRVHDGIFRERFNHCWLEKVDGNLVLILDVYPVGTMGGPLLIDNQVFGLLYAPRPERFKSYQEGFEKDLKVLLEVSPRNA